MTHIVYFQSHISDADTDDFWYENTSAQNVPQSKNYSEATEKMVHITWRGSKHDMPWEIAPTVKQHLHRNQSAPQLTSQNEQSSTNGWCKSPIAYALQQNYSTLVQLKWRTRADYGEERKQRGDTADKVGKTKFKLLRTFPIFKEVRVVFWPLSNLFVFSLLNFTDLFFHCNDSAPCEALK